jgi:hypothetical protein
MPGHRAADDFPTIRARLKELRGERDPVEDRRPENNLRARVRRLPIEEIVRVVQRRLRKRLS